MVEVGDPAILTDDRWMADSIHWHGRQYQRGAWHLWHPDCFELKMKGQEPCHE